MKQKPSASIIRMQRFPQLPNTHPQPHRSRRRRKILLAMPMDNPRRTGIVHYAREVGWIVDTTLPYYHAIGKDLQYFDAGLYDGILAGCERSMPWLPKVLRHFHVPIVDMWMDYPELPYPRVLLDNVGIGRVAAEHLLAKGFRNFLLYSNEIEGVYGSLRRQGFQEALKSAGICGEERIANRRKGQKDRNAATASLASFLSQSAFPIAVFGTKDATASEILDAADQAGLSVPSQVAVIGVDNDPVATELALVPLTSVDSARERAGYEAAELLDRLMDGAAPPSEPILTPPGPVVARRSTDWLATRHPIVTAAIQYIQDHFAEPITADEIAAEAGLSRRHLDNHMLRDTGRTIKDVLNWQRMAFAQNLLVSTRTKVQIVAERSGFSSGENLCKVFRRMVGMTPHQYRERYTTKDSQAGISWQVRGTHMPRQ